jgi:hypothetical protein
VSQEKGKTVTFASDDMVLHYGGQNRHRRKSTPASLNRTPLLHHQHHQHQMIQQQPQYHQPSTALLLQQQQHHHLRFSPPVSAHLRHWLAPGIETSKKSKLRVIAGPPLLPQNKKKLKNLKKKNVAGLPALYRK